MDPARPAQGSEPAPGLKLEGREHYLSVNSKTIHWGYFSRLLDPVLEIESGDLVTIETLFSPRHAPEPPPATKPVIGAQENA